MMSGRSLPGCSTALRTRSSPSAAGSADLPAGPRRCGPGRSEAPKRRRRSGGRAPTAPGAEKGQNVKSASQLEEAAGPPPAPPDGGVSPAIEARDLRKRFGDFEAVQGVSFDVMPGETFGFLGPNGAGKSTTISMLCTLLRPTGGRALVAGHDVVAEYCDRRAVMDGRVIVVTGTPEELKAGVGKDRVQLRTDDDELARARLQEVFGLEAVVSEGGLTVYVTDGEEFVPRLFASLGV